MFNLSTELLNICTDQYPYRVSISIQQNIPNRHCCV